VPHIEDFSQTLQGKTIFSTSHQGLSSNFYCRKGHPEDSHYYTFRYMAITKHGSDKANLYFPWKIIAAMLSR